MESPLTDKNILVTGGTGSFGQKFCEIALKQNPKVIRIYSRDELKQSEMSRKFNDDRLRFFIGDVRDKDRLTRATENVDIIVHAAALKRIESCEYNPQEAVYTNINGAINVIDSAIANNVEKVIAISSDKACSPINTYGKCKAVMESLIVQANVYSRDRTKFSCTRYGNVSSSRGSLIPKFLEQKSRGELLTLTHGGMTRFWLTLEQGVNFVVNSLSMMRGGEIFIPKIPSLYIIELANIIDNRDKKDFIGIRPSEKLQEILVTEEEARHTKEFEDYYVIYPEFPFWTEDTYWDETGESLPIGFEYSSHNNNRWLTREELVELIKEAR